MKSRMKLLPVLLALALLLTACSSESAPQATLSEKPSSSGFRSSYSGGMAESYDYESSYFMDDEAVSPSPNTGGGGDSADIAIVHQRKIVKNASLNLETMEFDRAIEELVGLVNSVGGYIEYQNVSGKSLYYSSDTYERYASINARVPAEQLDAIIGTVGEICNITSKNESVEDITDSYYDSQARLESLELQEDRLLEILAQATSLEDIIALESALSNVRYQIEYITSSLRRMDSQVSYSYLTMYISEVVEYNVIQSQPRTFGQKLGQSLSRSASNIAGTLQGILFFIIEQGPVLIIYGIILAAVIFVVIKIVKKVEKNRPKPPTPPVGPGQYQSTWGTTTVVTPPAPPSEEPEVPEAEKAPEAEVEKQAETGPDNDQ